MFRWCVNYGDDLVVVCFFLYGVVKVFDVVGIDCLFDDFLVMIFSWFGWVSDLVHVCFVVRIFV